MRWDQIGMFSNWKAVAGTWQAKEKRGLDETHGKKGPWIGPQGEPSGFSSKWDGKPQKSLEQESERPRLNDLPKSQIEANGKAGAAAQAFRPPANETDKEMRSLGDSEFTDIEERLGQAKAHLTFSSKSPVLLCQGWPSSEGPSVRGLAVPQTPSNYSFKIVTTGVTSAGKDFTDVA